MTDVISSEAVWARTHQFDPPSVFDSLRAERPLARMSYPDGHVGWVASSHEVARKVLGDPRFSHSTEICLGQNLARVELRAGLSALLRAFPDLWLAVETDEVPLRLRGSIFAVQGLPVSW